MSAPRSSEPAKVAAAWASSGTWPQPLMYRAAVWAVTLAAAWFAGGWPLVALVAALGGGAAAVRTCSVTSLAAMGLWERLDRTPGAGPAALVVAAAFAVARLGLNVPPWRAALAVTAVAVAVAVTRRLRAGAARQRVAVGEVLWAKVRFEGRDAAGATSKVRPVLVVRDTGSGLEVLYMTSRGDRYDGRPGWLRIEGRWHRDPSWVDTTRRLRIPYRAVERRAGALEGRQLDRVLDAARSRGRSVQRR